MSPDHVAVFRTSLNRCLGASGFLESFYESFVGSSEEVREKFKNTDMKRQIKMLEDSLYVLAVAAQGGQGSPAWGALPGIARRHSRHDLDIRPGLYDLWLTSLVETARRYDPDFIDATEVAWRDALAAGIEYMRSHY